jgi:hypothetical protein
MPRAVRTVRWKCDPLGISLRAGGSVFSTCLYCHSGLGHNEVLEQFPVGRRLAFDHQRGRLWVICRQCQNWNLSPLEERWETVEACERLYRDTTVRVSTDNIGLATLSAGLDLVRVGTPLRPEFAAWRYGSRLRRRRFHVPNPAVAASSLLTSSAALMVGSIAAMAGVTYELTSSRRWQQSVQRPLELLESRLQYDKTVAHVRTPDGTLRPLRFSHIARLELLAGSEQSPWQLRVAHSEGVLDLDAAQAVQVASPLLARLNNRGGSLQQVADATRRITDAGDAERYIRTSAQMRQQRRRKNAIFWDDDVGVLGLTPTERLALEIAMNEDAERQAMQGELQALEDAWRDAEQIAAIADAMFVD